MKIYASPKLAVFLMLFTLSACKKVLDLQPAQSISNEIALSDDESVKQVLIGAYNTLSSSNLLGGELHRNAELFGGIGQIKWLGTFTGPREIFNHEIITTNFDVEVFWTDAYATINTANNVLSALDVVDANDREQVQGEALLIRAWLFFELTRFYGQQYEAGVNNIQPGIPIVTSPSLSTTDNATVSRNTVEECYTQILADLTLAESLLPEENDEFANKSVAAALLSRVYLQMENYSAARDAADRVIAGGIYELTDTYAAAFMADENTSEDIFSIQISEQDGSNAMNTFFSTSAFGGRGDIEIEQDFIDSFDPADDRLTLYYQVANKWRTGKFNNQFGNLAAIRLAEMYLTRAECNYRLGTGTGAAPLDDFNVTRERALLPPAVSVTLEEILAERRFELAHEGLLLHDIKRLKGNVGGFPYNDNLMVFPIPQREIDANSNLVQNPGY